ncbi:MAG: DUF4990 domain-containing protein [Solimonas sp.]
MKCMLPALCATTLALFQLPAFAADFYVSPNGSDDAKGTLKAPFATLMKAQAAASPGDTVYLRGGTYHLSNADITTRDKKIYSVVNHFTKKRIRYVNYSNERPIFDFTNVKPAGDRVTAFLVATDQCVFKGFDIVGVQVTIADQRTQSEAIRVEGGNDNRFEQLAIHDGMGIGWYLVKGRNNLVLNVDAYRNKGLNHFSDGNVDGFGGHPQSADNTGNVIRGSRAWFNSDDGFDFINAKSAMTVENSWAMYNGYDSDFKALGDGNGFKGGGYGRNGKPYPVPTPRHQVRFCLSVGNLSSGFYANHHIGGQDWINNTGIGNHKANFNMLSTLEDNATDVPGYQQRLKNNLSYGAAASINLGDDPRNDVSHNSFQLAGDVTAADFISLDEAQLTAPRQANGDLPVITYAHLAPGSRLIDAGVDVGVPYNGKAPDLGAFEAPASVH